MILVGSVMYEESVGKEIAFADLLALETLALKAPGVYAHIRACPQAYTGNQPEQALHIETDEKVVEGYVAERKAQLGAVADQTIRPTLARLLEFLFPLTGEHNFEDREPAYLERRGRVASPQRLRVALSIGVPSDEFPLEDARTFLTDPATRAEVLSAGAGDLRFLRLMEQLSLLLEEVDVTDTKNFVLGLAAAIDTPAGLQLELDPRDVLALSPVRQVWRVCATVIGKCAPAEREAILLSLARSGVSISMATHAIGKCATDLGLIGSGRAPVSEPWCPTAKWPALCRAWVKSLNAALSAKKLFTISARSLTLHMLADISPKDAKKLLLKSVKDPQLLEGFAVAVTEGSRDSRKGRLAERNDELAKVFGLSSARAKLRAALKQQPFQSDEKVALQVLLDGRSRYFLDGSLRPR